MDLFPSLQVDFWEYYKDMITIENNAYLPSKSQLYFVLNNHKMLIKKEKNCICLAIEMRNKSLTLSEIKAFDFAKTRITILSRKYSINPSNITEYVVLRGREQNLNMKYIRYKYSIENLRKISIHGINRRYFPVVDEYYNTSELLLESYTPEQIIDILLKQTLVIYKYKENSSDEFNPSKIEGMGFYIPFDSKWYIVTTIELDSYSRYFASDYIGRIIDLTPIYNDKIKIFIPNIKENNLQFYPEITISFNKVNKNGYKFISYLSNDRKPYFVKLECSRPDDNGKVFKCDNNILLKRSLIGSIIFDTEEKKGIGIISKINIPDKLEYVDIDIVFETLEKINSHDRDKRR